MVGFGIGSVGPLYFITRVRSDYSVCMSVQCLVDCFRRDAAVDDLAVKPITQFPVTLDDEVRIRILVFDWFLTLYNDTVSPS